MVHAITVEPMGLSGGLALFWNDTIQMQELVKNCIDWGALWVIAADFNVIIDGSEKQGGRSRDTWTFRDFKNFIWNLGAIDLGYNGKPWTWWCYRENEGIIQERLDRVLVSPNWKIKFENVNVQHIETEVSNHSALMLSSDAEPIRKKKRFYFDKRWIEREGVQNIISKAWSYDCNALSNLELALKSNIAVDLWWLG
ncbi:hypothetical protein KY289_035618 [Solanum tuberosum]|nr:hypothetical protein KY289_035618 [Solanum tuberosum]